MNTRISARGNAFESGSDVDAAVDLLQSHVAVFALCIEKVALANKLEAVPRYRLSEIRPGSIDIRLFTEIGAALVPLAPEVVRQVWTMYKAVYDLISIASRQMRKDGKPMNITVSNSPGVTINMVSGDQFVVGSDVMDAASKKHKLFARLAGLVKNRRADRILIEADAVDDLQRVVFDATNQDDFDLPTAQMQEQTPILIECGIIRFNKRTLRGYLEYEDADIRHTLPFTIDPALLETCLKAFALDNVRARVLKKIEVNALGEDRAIELHVVAIEA